MQGEAQSLQPQPHYLQQDSVHISVTVIRVELAQQQFCREPLAHKVGDSVAIVAIEDPIEVTAVLTPVREDRGTGVKGACGVQRPCPLPTPPLCGNQPSATTGLGCWRLTGTSASCLPRGAPQCSCHLRHRTGWEQSPLQRAGRGAGHLSSLSAAPGNRAREGNGESEGSMEDASEVN